MEYIKKQLEPRGTRGGSVAFHNGLQPVRDIMVPLSGGYRPLVWLARVIGVREPDSTQIASTRDGRGAEINQRWEWSGKDNEDREGVYVCVCVCGGQLVVRRGGRGVGESKGQREG